MRSQSHRARSFCAITGAQRSDVVSPAVRSGPFLLQCGPRSQKDGSQLELNTNVTADVAIAPDDLADILRTAIERRSDHRAFAAVQRRERAARREPPDSLG